MIRFEPYSSWPYPDALAWMEASWREVVAGGAMRVAVGTHEPEVVTLGRNAETAHVLDEEGLADRGVGVVRTDRGGGATVHGPGQLVLYPIVDLRKLRLSVPAFTAVLEQTAIAFLDDHGIVGTIEPGLPGVYVEGRKVASLGFRWRRGVVTHGLSLNLENDLSLFTYIVACGEHQRQPTSMKQELGTSPLHNGTTDSARSMERLANHFQKIIVLGSERAEVTEAP